MIQNAQKNFNIPIQKSKLLVKKSKLNWEKRYNLNIIIQTDKTLYNSQRKIYNMNVHTVTMSGCQGYWLYKLGIK